MNFPTRLILILILMLPLASRIAAQEEVPATETVAEETASTDTVGADAETEPAASQATEKRSNYEVRNMFSSRLREHPRDLATVLALEPALLRNEEFLSQYPLLAEFVAEYPEVQQNPRFYLLEFGVRRTDSSILDDILEGLTIFAVFTLIAFALAWVVRTIIEQKRWNRLSRTQSEVHNKILDRFGTTAELLEYIRTPAATKFLEAAPIPVNTQPITHNPSLVRVMWSVQIGVVVAAASLGMLLVSFWIGDEESQALLAMGAIGF